MKFLIKLGSRLLDLLFPPKCFSCGTPVPPEHLFCPRCYAPERITHKVCPVCAKTQCICKQLHPEFEAAVTLYAYEGDIRRGIHMFKYNGGAVYGRLLGEHLGKACLHRFGASLPFQAVTYVPASKAKAARRGYIPAKLLAASCARVLSLPVKENLILHTGNTKAQATVAHPSERLDNAKRSFVLPEPPMDLSGQSVLLVDDIFTTGSTLNRCAALLKAQGARVYCATVCSTGRKTHASHNPSK